MPMIEIEGKGHVIEVPVLIHGRAMIGDAFESLVEDAGHAL
jgi:hypothetical protein